MSIYSVLLMVIMNLDISNAKFKTIVHDSVWDIPFVYAMGGQFRWANDNSKGFEKTSIFNNFEHLGLNWNDTKVFQNPNHKQFDKVEDITKLYLKSPDAKHSFYPTMLVNPWTYAQHYRYVKLKDELTKDGKLKEGGLKDMFGAGSILMANEKGKIIALHDYITWINCNYGLAIKTERNEDFIPSNLSEEKLCSGTPLQNYVKGGK